MLKGMKRRKKELQKIKRNTSLLKKLTQSFRDDMDRDMNNTAKKAKFTFTDSLQEEMMNKIETRLGKGKPNVDTVAQLTKDIYERIGQRYKQNKSIGHVVNETHSKVIGGGQPRSYVPHATVRVRLNKKTGQYEMNIWAPKTETRPERVGKVNGTVKVDQRLKDRLKEKIQSHTRNFLVKPGAESDAKAEPIRKYLTTFQTIKPSTKLYSFTLPNSEEYGRTYETTQTIYDNLSVTKRSIDKKITSKATRTKARKVGRPTINKLNRITRVKRSSRKGRPTGTRTRKSRSGSVSVRQSKTPITLSSKRSNESDLRKNLDRQVKILFNQTRLRQETDARPPDLSILDAIKKEIGSIADNWPVKKIPEQSKTMPYPPYKNRFVKEHRFTKKFETRPSFLTTQNLDKVIIPTVMSPLFNTVSYTKSQIQTTARKVLTQTAKPAVKRMSDMHFTYLPRVFTFSPITMKPLELTTRKRYVFTPKYIFESSEDSKSDSEMTYLTALPKRKKEKQSKKLYTVSKFTAAPKVSMDTSRTESSTVYNILKDKTLSPVTKRKVIISERNLKSEQGFTISSYKSQKDLQSNTSERLSDKPTPKPTYVFKATVEPTYIYKARDKPTYTYKPTYIYKARDKPTYTYKPSYIYKTTDKPTYSYKSTVEPTYIYKATDKPTYSYKSTVEPTYIYKATDKPTYSYKSTVEPTYIYKARDKPTYTYKPTYIYKTTDKTTYTYKPTFESIYIYKATDKPTYDYKSTVEPTYIYKATDKPTYSYKSTVEPTYIYKATDKPTYDYKSTVEPTYIYKARDKPTYSYKPTYIYKARDKPTYTYKPTVEPTYVYEPGYVFKPTESQDALKMKKQHYFSFGTVRGGYKQFDDSWWRLSQRLNRNRVRGPNSRFAQPLHLRGKTFSQQPLRPQNRNKPFRSVRTFLSGIRQASSNTTTESVQSEISTLVPFLQSKIRQFYEHKIPLKRARSIRPYYNIRLHPMNPVDSLEYTTTTSVEDKWIANELDISDVTRLNISRTVIHNDTFEDVSLKRKPTSVSTEKIKTSTLKQKYRIDVSEPEISSSRSFIKKEIKSVYTPSTVGSDSLETTSELFGSTTDKSKTKTTTPAGKTLPPAFKKPKVISVFTPESFYKSPTLAPLTFQPKHTTEKSYSSVKKVLESDKTTDLPPWMAKVTWPSYKIPIEQTIKPYAAPVTSISPTVELKDLTQKSTTVPIETVSKTVSKLPKFKFVWPTLKKAVLSTSTHMWKATKAFTSFPSIEMDGPKIITSTAESTVKSELNTDKKVETSFLDSDVTSESYSTLPTSNQTFVPTFFTKKVMPNFMWPTFQTPSTFAPILSTDSQTVEPTFTDEFISNVVWPTFKTSNLRTVVPTDSPSFTTENFIPRGFWPTFQRYRSFRPKRVQRPYRNPRWTVRYRDLSSRKTRYPKITKSPQDQFKMTSSTYEKEKTIVEPTYETMLDLETSTEYSKPVSNYFSTEIPDVVRPPYEETSKHIVQPLPTIVPILQSRSEQTVTEMKWPPQETSTQAKLATKKSVETFDSALYPDLDELTDETTKHSPLPTRRRNSTRPRPTKWWLDYVYPEVYRKHVEDSSLDEYYSDTEEDVTFLPFDHNTTGTPYYSKLRFGGTWYTFRPIYVRPTTPAPPTTTVLTTKPPPTTPKPKIHHIIKKGFKKFLNIFKFGKRNKQNEEESK